jgi:hypothetical protein
VFIWQLTRSSNKQQSTSGIRAYYVADQRIAKFT